MGCNMQKMTASCFGASKNEKQKLASDQANGKDSLSQDKTKNPLQAHVLNEQYQRKQVEIRERPLPLRRIESNYKGEIEAEEKEEKEQAKPKKLSSIKEFSANQEQSSNDLKAILLTSYEERVKVEQKVKINRELIKEQKETASIQNNSSQNQELVAIELSHNTQQLQVQAEQNSKLAKQDAENKIINEINEVLQNNQNKNNKNGLQRESDNSCDEIEEISILNSIINQIEGGQPSPIIDSKMVKLEDQNSIMNQAAQPQQIQTSAKEINKQIQNETNFKLNQKQQKKIQQMETKQKENEKQQQIDIKKRPQVENSQEVNEKEEFDEIKQKTQIDAKQKDETKKQQQVEIKNENEIYIEAKQKENEKQQQIDIQKERQIEIRQEVNEKEEFDEIKQKTQIVANQKYENQIKKQQQVEIKNANETYIETKQKENEKQQQAVLINEHQNGTKLNKSELSQQIEIQAQTIKEENEIKQKVEIKQEFQIESRQKESEQNDDIIPHQGQNINIIQQNELKMEKPIEKSLDESETNESPIQQKAETQIKPVVLSKTQKKNLKKKAKGKKK